MLVIESGIYNGTRWYLLYTFLFPVWVHFASFLPLLFSSSRYIKYNCASLTLFYEHESSLLDFLSFFFFLSLHNPNSTLRILLLLCDWHGINIPEFRRLMEFSSIFLTMTFPGILLVSRNVNHAFDFSLGSLFTFYQISP